MIVIGLILAPALIDVCVIILSMLISKKIIAFGFGAKHHLEATSSETGVIQAALCVVFAHVIGISIYVASFFLISSAELVQFFIFSCAHIFRFSFG